jgi:hypothetical protein
MFRRFAGTFALIGAALSATAIAAEAKVGEAPRKLAPGGSFTITFPDMPATFEELVDAKGIKPQMTVFLPKNYEPAGKHPLLIAYGGKALRPERLAEYIAGARAGGVELTTHEMKNIGHAFPESEYPAVRRWLRGPAIGRSPEGKGPLFQEIDRRTHSKPFLRRLSPPPAPNFFPLTTSRPWCISPCWFEVVRYHYQSRPTGSTLASIGKGRDVQVNPGQGLPAPDVSGGLRPDPAAY